MLLDIKKTVEYSHYIFWVRSAVAWLTFAALWAVSIDIASGWIAVKVVSAIVGCIWFVAGMIGLVSRSADYAKKRLPSHTVTYPRTFSRSVYGMV